ncbi:hypothetical protein RJ640_011959 [Escallonia rubra]|uniref:J domain-containing protein n=1 Tax=Escallonia rubra TaxID=112253 RepID=A0AA88USP8_9ASTE|nr:hypothetical protein RJ640_011959 [Escallonia rubra]
MHSAILPLGPPTPSIITLNPNPKTFGFFNAAAARKPSDSSLLCKATTVSSSSSITDFDLYGLLGVDDSSDHAQIKLAYRSLQKRCHPDIAGAAGHDMAIILNEAYAVLSDPNLRYAYDKEQAKVAGLRGYTGKPLYSAWFGSEAEERAVFVDEVKCVGCLKCALLAEKTFAVESAYGRARVVAQWADPEHKIQEAIEACPVDCISMVERSKLAALEFLMSKQPRGNVRIGAGNTAGTRVSNIFVDVEKFQANFQDAREKTSKKQSTESDLQREARISAFQTIRAISNWLYWQPPTAGRSAPPTSQILKRLPEKSMDADIHRLRDAATARKQARESAKPVGIASSNHVQNDVYWTPSSLDIPESTQNGSGTRDASESLPTKDINDSSRKTFAVEKKRKRNPLVWAFPVATGTVAALIVRLQLGESVPARLEEHIGGSVAANIVNSSWSQAILAGITWYLIATYVADIVEALLSKVGVHKE